LNDEIARSRKSLAIRKINGATVNNIVRIFVTDIWKIAIPSVILGLAGAWYLASRVVKQFCKADITSLVRLSCNGHRHPPAGKCHGRPQLVESRTAQPRRIT